LEGKKENLAPKNKKERKKIVFRLLAEPKIEAQAKPEWSPSRV
jgi:hypothetical protein